MKASISVLVTCDCLLRIPDTCCCLLQYFGRLEYPHRNAGHPGDGPYVQQTRPTEPCSMRATTRFLLRGRCMVQGAQGLNSCCRCLRQTVYFQKFERFRNLTGMPVAQTTPAFLAAAFTSPPWASFPKALCMSAAPNHPAVEFKVDVSLSGVCNVLVGQNRGS